MSLSHFIASYGYWAVFALVTAESLGLGIHAAHPQDVAHYMGLYFMSSRGAELIDTVEIAPR